MDAQASFTLRIIEIKMNPKFGYVARHSASAVYTSFSRMKQRK